MKKNTIIYLIVFVLIPTIIFAFSISYGPNGFSYKTKGTGDTISGLLTMGLFVGIFGLLFYGFVIYPILRKKKIKEFCKKNNAKYIAYMQELPMGKNFLLTNIIEKNNSYEAAMVGKRGEFSFLLCDYRFNTSLGHVYHFGMNTICVISMKGLNMPHFSIGEYNLNSKIYDFDLCSLNSLKGRKVFYKFDKNFSDRFFIKTDDVEKTRNFFNDRIRDIFKNIKISKYYYEGMGDTFVVSYASMMDLQEKIDLLNHSVKLLSSITENIR